MKNKTDIVFLSPPLIWGQENRMDIKPPLNLMYLASYIKTKGIKARIMDVLSEKLKLNDAVKAICDENPAFLGVPFYHASLDTVLEVCREVKKQKPSIKIIGGGPTMTIHPGELLSCEEVDIGVTGEGEITLEEIVRSDEECYDRIDGMAFKYNGKVCINKRRTHCDMDMLPFLDYSLVNMEPYFDYQKTFSMPESIFLTSSRGCSFRCIYCATPQLWPGPVRRYSPERVVEEVKYQISMFPGINIGFMDDSFFSSRKWLYEFCSKIIKLGVSYSCIGRGDHLNKELIELLAKTGCHYVALGVETGNQERQKKIKKYLDLKKTKENVKCLLKNNIPVKCFFMLGFPDETPEEMAETINFAVDLRKAGMFKFNFFPVVIYPGTELAERFKKSCFKSKIYEHFTDPSTISDFGERNITMYSTIPDEDINSYLCSSEIVELTKLAYNKVEAREYISAGDIMELVKSEK